MLLSILFNLRFHLPHLEVNETIRAFFMRFLRNPKCLSYEKMIGLPFLYNPAKVLRCPLTKAFTLLYDDRLEEKYEEWKAGSIELTLEELVEFGFGRPNLRALPHGVVHNVYSINSVAKKSEVAHSFQYTRGNLSFGIPIEIVGAGCELDNVEGIVLWDD